MNALQSFIMSKPFGFLTAADMPRLIELDRLCPCLVRCGRGRFTCAAQDVAHFVMCVDRGGDYVRDVAFPVGSFERAATWVGNPAPGLVPHVPDPKYGEKMKQNIGLNSMPSRALADDFNEAECGGVYDGRQVTSVADPGL